MPENFFEPEVRSGYQVSTESKKLWAVELDLLNEFKRVCKDYGLSYYAVGGTLIGAARHKGFIPWDDDIDVAMMWDDFKKFMEIAPNEFKNPYFFQSYKTDDMTEVSHARIRNSMTTGFTQWEHDNIHTPPLVIIRAFLWIYSSCSRFRRKPQPELYKKKRLILPGGR